MTTNSKQTPEALLRSGFVHPPEIPHTSVPRNVQKLSSQFKQTGEYFPTCRDGALRQATAPRPPGR